MENEDLPVVEEVIVPAKHYSSDEDLAVEYIDEYEQDDLVKGIFDKIVDYIRRHALPLGEYIEPDNIEELIESILV